jgi:hypothetical protein
VLARSHEAVEPHVRGRGFAVCRPGHRGRSGACRQAMAPAPILQDAAARVNRRGDGAGRQGLDA